MRNKAGNSVILILIGVFVIGVFLLLAVFGTDFGERLGLLSQRKTEQQAEAKGPPVDKGKSLPATLTVSPNPVPAMGTEYTVTGSGFKTDQWAYFSTTCQGAFNVWVDSSGGVSITHNSRFAGVCTYDVYQYTGTRNNKLTLMASLTFEVVGQ